MTLSIIKNTVAARIHEVCVEYGDFTLASGQKSDFYIDLRKFTFSTDVEMLFHLLKEEVKDFDGGQLDAIGGPALGAIPIASMYITKLAVLGIKLKSFAVRSATKEHGMQNLIEGPIKPGDVVCVFEDVTTTGKSGMKAVQALLDYGCEIWSVVTVVDRLQGGRELYEKNNIHFNSVFTIDDILSHKV